MNKILCVLAAAGALVSGPAVQAITYNYNAGVLHQTDAFASFNTTGAEMAGMGVHVVYTNGSTYDATWQAFGTGFGGVNDSNLFFQAGNTGSNAYAWILHNRSATLGIRSVSFDGQPGNTVFDVSFPFGQYAGPSYIGTPGTSTGRELDLYFIYSNLYGGMTVTYSDAVGLAGADPLGDVYRRMTIDFVLDRPLFQDGIVEFRQDTDSLAFGSVLAPVTPPATPEGGATLAMLCTGLAGLVAGARRRAAPACA